MSATIPDTPRIDAETLRHLAAVAGVTIAPGHVPGVIRNLEALLAQAELLFMAPLDPLVEPAATYFP